MKKLFIIMMILPLCYAVKAQSTATNEKFSTQLKNGTVPGWQYSKGVSVTTPVTNSKENKTESLAAQIRKGTAPGMKFLPTPAANTSAHIVQKGPAVKAAPLASEQMPGPVTVPQIKVIPAPTQEEPKEKIPAVKQ